METNNKIELIGTINTQPAFYHEIFGEKFYSFDLKAHRLSDNDDILPIFLSERLIDINSLKINDKIRIIGQLRSYNVNDEQNEGRIKLVLKTFVKEIEILETETDETSGDNDKDVIELNGYICKPPVYRQTPKGREICDIFLAVNRNYHKSDYIPTICWGRNARFAKNLEVGQHIKAIGRLQSRDYNKRVDEETFVKKTAYEVSISKIELIESNRDE